MMKAALSFSGGKDSSFALHKLQEEGVEVACLITTIWRESGETVAHGEKEEKIEKQASELGIPLEYIVTDFEGYTDDFKKRLMEIKGTYGIHAIGFGDIYLEGHREWGEDVAEAANLAALYPLWTKEENAAKVLRDYVAAGFKSKIIKVDEAKLPGSWIGIEIDADFISDVLKYNVCPLGEAGEYHSYVYDGPIFQKGKKSQS